MIRNAQTSDMKSNFLVNDMFDDKKLALQNTK